MRAAIPPSARITQTKITLFFSSIYNFIQFIRLRLVRKRIDLDAN